MVVGWRMPRQANGELLSFDVHLYTPAGKEGVIAMVGSDQTYFAISEQSEYKHSDTLVQVRCI